MLDTLYRDLGHGYRPGPHSDIIDLESHYSAPEDNALFVAEVDGSVVGTAGVRGQTPTSPPHPVEVTCRFEEGRTATLRRVYVRPEHRRRGLGDALARRCLAFIASRERYTGVHLYVDARAPGAVAFWSRYGKAVYDERIAVNEMRPAADDPLGAPAETVHFQIAIRRGPEDPGREARPGYAQDRGAAPGGRDGPSAFGRALAEPA